MANDNAADAPPQGVPSRIVDALEQDAAAIAELLVASIEELCNADHKGDPAVIARWTANKTPQNVARWIADPGQRVLAGWEGDALVAVGAIAPGEIRLNYVAPAYRFRGHSKTMLRVMEACLVLAGSQQAELTTTVTARRLYLSQGWSDLGEAEEHGGLVCQRMTKHLRAG